MGIIHTERLTTASYLAWRSRHQRWLKHRIAELNGKRPRVSKGEKMIRLVDRRRSLHQMRREALERMGEVSSSTSR